MATDSGSASVSNSSQSPPGRRSLWSSYSFLWLVAPVATAVLLYRLEPFDPAPFPIDELAAEAMVVPSSNGRMLEGSEKVGAGLLAGPEDIAYDPGSQVIYTGCGDGRIVRVRVNDSTVENWVNTGGRPLGLALGPNNEIIVADALKVSSAM